MDFQWRGWGFSVALLLAFWIFVLIAVVVFAAPYEPDRHMASLKTQWLFAGMFALHALSVFVVVVYRRKHPSVAESGADPRGDEFMFIRLELWPYILLALAAVLAGASSLGYSLVD